MKFRKGFVSNSSSSCFILDLCDKKTENIVKKLKKQGVADIANDTYYLTSTRHTCFGIGNAVTKFAEVFTEDNDEENNFSKWIFDAIKQLGKENIVFIRVSDEDNGIDFNIEPTLIYTESEYH